MDKQALKDILHKSRSIFNRGLSLVCIAALSSAVTYFVCSSKYEQTLEDLDEQIKKLKAEEQEARINKRISQQMEEIAYDQKTISDKQTERAIHEAQLADIERNKAEFERIKAQKAEQAANASAAHADSMSMIAHEQTALAIQNLHAAQQAQAHSDTLLYKSLSSSLAQSSITQAGTNNDLSRILAYASWHYANLYSTTEPDNGNVYKALLNATTSSETLKALAKGDIRSMKTVTIKSKRYILAVSDFGEILYLDSLCNPTVISSTSRYCRDIALAPHHRYATITSDGEVSLTDYEAEFANTASTPTTATLPNDIWTHIIPSPDSTMLIAMSRHTVTWLSSTDLHIIATANTEQENTALGYSDNMLHIFCKGNIHLTSDTPGTLTRGVTFTSDNTTASNDVRESIVTAYLYDKQDRYHILGLDNGDIEYHDANGALVRTLSGHQGAITHLDKDDNTLISSSYDMSMRFWFVQDLNSLITSADKEFPSWPLTFALDHENKIVWIATKNGGIDHFSYSAEANARKTHLLLRREFTTNEWNYYIGSTIPYRTFIINK